LVPVHNVAAILFEDVNDDEARRDEEDIARAASEGMV
jgi:hypothetical protein